MADSETGRASHTPRHSLKFSKIGFIIEPGIVGIDERGQIVIGNAVIESVPNASHDLFLSDIDKQAFPDFAQMPDIEGSAIGVNAAINPAPFTIEENHVLRGQALPVSRARVVARGFRFPQFASDSKHRIPVTIGAILRAMHISGFHKMAFRIAD